MTQNFACFGSSERTVFWEMYDDTRCVSSRPPPYLKGKQLNQCSFLPPLCAPSHFLSPEEPAPCEPRKSYM